MELVASVDRKEIIYFTLILWLIGRETEVIVCDCYLLSKSMLQLHEVNVIFTYPSVFLLANKTGFFKTMHRLYLKKIPHIIYFSQSSHTYIMLCISFAVSKKYTHVLQNSLYCLRLWQNCESTFMFRYSCMSEIKTHQYNMRMKDSCLPTARFPVSFSKWAP